MDERDADRLAREWWDAISGTSFVPMSSHDARATLAGLLVELSSALSDADFDPAVAVEVGNALVRMRLTNPIVVSRSAEVLATLPALAHGGRPIRNRGPSMLGAFGSGYAAALQRKTLNDQAAVHNALASASQAATDALQSSNTRFKVVFENAAVAIGVVDTTGCVIEANPALAAMVDRCASDLPGIALSDLVHPDDWPRVLDKSTRDSPVRTTPLCGPS